MLTRSAVSANVSPRCLLLLTFLALATLPRLSAGAGARPDNDWTKVTSLQSGTPVEVIHGALRRASGKLITAAPDSITVETESGTSIIPVSEVRRVSVTITSRKKSALIGMAIGAGAAAAIAAVAATTSDIDIRYDLLIGVPVALGAGAGAAIGASLGGPRTVYRAP